VAAGNDRRYCQIIDSSPRQKTTVVEQRENISKEFLQGCFQAALARWSRCRELLLVDFQLHLVASSRLEAIAESNRD